MSEIGRHYAEGGPAEKIAAALDRISPDGGPLTLDQLTGFDHFHSAGLAATVGMADLLAPTATDTVLDAGCGVGGPARYLADRFGCRVIGIDLTPEFIEVARMLNERTGMSDRVEVRVGDITALDLDDASVDHAWTQHVAMNIADRPGLYAEIRRVMRPGGRFAIFDVIDGGAGDLLLPVPWATKAEHSHLVTATELRTLVEGAGFVVEAWDDPTQGFVEATKAMLSSSPSASGPPVLTPALFIDDVATKGATYLRNMEEGRTALAQVLCTAA